MADISTMTLPNGDSYNIKDSEARKVMVGASIIARKDGEAGLVPAPTSYDEFKVLNGGGQWTALDGQIQYVYVNPSDKQAYQNYDSNKKTYSDVISKFTKGQEQDIFVDRNTNKIYSLQWISATDTIISKYQLNEIKTDWNNILNRPTKLSEFTNDLLNNGAFRAYQDRQGLETAIAPSNSSNIGTTWGEYSFNVGLQNNTIGDYSHAEGKLSVANGNYSYVHGNSVVSGSDYTHVFGHNNWPSEYEPETLIKTNFLTGTQFGSGTYKIGTYVVYHGEPYRALADVDTTTDPTFPDASDKWQLMKHKPGDSYFVEIAQSSTGLHYGYTLTVKNQLEIVGNGDSNKPSNARVLYEDGSEWLADTLSVSREPKLPEQVTTKNYVDQKTKEASESEMQEMLKTVFNGTSMSFDDSDAADIQKSVDMAYAEVYGE